MLFRTVLFKHRMEQRSMLWQSWWFKPINPAPRLASRVKRPRRMCQSGYWKMSTAPSPRLQFRSYPWMRRCTSFSIWNMGSPYFVGKHQGNAGAWCSLQVWSRSNWDIIRGTTQWGRRPLWWKVEGPKLSSGWPVLPAQRRLWASLHVFLC